MGRFMNLSTKCPFEWVVTWEKMNGKKSTRKVRAWNRSTAEAMFKRDKPKSYRRILSTDLVE